jgi:hypothetical protein
MMAFPSRGCEFAAGDTIASAPIANAAVDDANGALMAAWLVVIEYKLHISFFGSRMARLPG